MPRLFLPQATLETWVAEEKADLREQRLLIPAENGSHALVPAVHFITLVSGSDDRGLLNKVKTLEQLTALSAEQMMDSVLLGEDAYEVVQGYVTEVAEPAAKKGNEADLLAEFLLNKL